MTKFNSKKQVEEYLNDMYSKEDVLIMTEHCWAGSVKSVKQQKSVKILAKGGFYGTILRKYDPIAFQVACNDLMR